MGERIDRLRMEYINSLPHPFLARFYGDKTFWPVNDFDVGTGLMRIDVCGKLQVKHFGEVAEIRDGDDQSHDPDTFYSDFVEQAEEANRLADGCCSASSPCGHQKRDPYSICDACAKAASRSEASPHV